MEFQKTIYSLETIPDNKDLVKKIKVYDQRGKKLQ